jgi:hypothetical protein
MPCSKQKRSKLIDIDLQYILEPLSELFATCHSTVLFGLRLVEKVERFPEPTMKELQFIQIVSSIGNSRSHDLLSSRANFKRWILRKGFGDIHQCVSVALQRLIVSTRVRHEAKQSPLLDLEECRRQWNDKVRAWGFPQLIDEASRQFPEPLEREEQFKSFNSARNCLEHGAGKVISRFCNGPSKDCLTISGRRFSVFFQKGGQKLPAVFGTPGPGNAALMLGAEDFNLRFGLGQSLDFSLEQFMDILHTCVFFRADLETKLAQLHARDDSPGISAESGG